MSRRFVPLCAGALVAIATFAQAAAASSFTALSGERAASYVVPDDAYLVRSLDLGANELYERYQQRHISADVYGGQITVYRDAAGTITSVVGSHYGEIATRNAVALSHSAAARVAARDVGAGNRAVDLLVHPSSGRYFYRVETRGFDFRWVHWVDAETGDVVRRYDALESDHGVGVKGDVKDMNGRDDASRADDLTTYHAASGHGAKSAHWDLYSTDNRQWTYDAKNRQSGQLYYVTDADNHWTATGRMSPGHGALVDAQYYASLTDDYFVARHGFNWGSCYTRMSSVAHYGKNYNNAFWNGTYTVYGDGDGTSTFRELSGGLDVVSHEHTHGITDCTSDLVYQNESGALNESFSDMLGNGAEYYAASGGLDATVTPDWYIGEDVYLGSTTVPGFRNMADPREDGDPDHYSERYTGTSDNGGVHTNSAIPNHAYYLVVNGGTNAGCDAIGSGGHSHTASCDVAVVGIGLDAAEPIFFRSFIALPSNATMCQARKATEAQASSLYGSGSQQHQSTTAAWNAVGVPTAC